MKKIMSFTLSLVMAFMLSMSAYAQTLPENGSVVSSAKTASSGMKYHHTVEGDLGLYGGTQATFIGALLILVELPSAPAAIASVATAAYVMGANNIYYTCKVYYQSEPYSAQKRVYTFYGDSARKKKIGSYTQYREYILDRVNV